MDAREHAAREDAQNVRRLSHHPDAATRASTDAGPCRNMGRDLLFVKCGSADRFRFGLAASTSMRA